MNYILIVSSVFLNCIAQVLMRFGMLSVGNVSLKTLINNFVNIATNYYIWAAMICFCGSVVLWLIVLSKFPVSFAYPWQSLGIVITAFFGYLLLGERFDLLKVIGIMLIGIGIVVLSKSNIE